MNKILLSCTLLAILPVDFPANKAKAMDDNPSVDDTNRCTLVADRDGVALRVYNGNENAQKEDLIWEGHLGKNEKKTIKSKKGLIRWDYKWDGDNDYHLDVSFTCHNNGEVKVP